MSGRRASTSDGSPTGTSGTIAASHEARARDHRRKHGARAAARESGERGFGLRPRALQRRNRSRHAGAFGLRQFEVVLADQAGVVALALQLDGVVARHQRVARDLQLGIEARAA